MLSWSEHYLKERIQVQTKNIYISQNTKKNFPRLLNKRAGSVWNERRGNLHVYCFIQRFLICLVRLIREGPWMVHFPVWPLFEYVWILFESFWISGSTQSWGFSMALETRMLPRFPRTWQEMKKDAWTFRFGCGFVLWCGAVSNM